VARLVCDVALIGRVDAAARDHRARLAAANANAAIAAADAAVAVVLAGDTAPAGAYTRPPLSSTSALCLG
jgi:hypothetical protein